MSVLDIGGDKGYIKKYIQDTKYVNIGYGPSVSIQYNLEQTPYPFEDKSFDVILCLDVLEHIDNIHNAFDECCRIAKKYCIISLPNPYENFIKFLYHGKYSNLKNMKFYSLQPEPENDRHKWFYSPAEARNFIEYRSKKNGYRIIQHEPIIEQSIESSSNAKALRAVFRQDLPVHDLLQGGAMWWLLERQE